MKKNLDIVKDYLEGNRPYTKVGYSGMDKYIIRKTGETWTDPAGKQWIQKDSGPQSVTKVMDIVRQEANETCSCCKREIRWGTKLDRKMYAKTGKCLDCVTLEETKLKATGKFKTYETKKMLSNELDYLKSLKAHLAESKQYLKEHKTFTFVNSNGLVEEWDNGARDDAMKNVQKDFVRCLKEIEKIEDELKKINNELGVEHTVA